MNNENSKIIDYYQGRPMQIVLLSITKDLRKKIIPNSILNHFQEIDFFYFSIPHDLSIIDQRHLIKHSTLFFLSQFMENIENSVRVEYRREVRKKIEVAKELSWEIFYRFNQWVKVCKGVFDEDLDWRISGFKGKIIDFYVDDGKSIFLISFSGNSLSKIPINHINQIFKETSPFYTYLESEFILPDVAPENLQADDKKKTDILFELPDFKDYQNESLQDFSDILNFWFHLFHSNLAVSEQVIINSSQQNVALLLDIPYFCERFGLWGTFSIGNKIMDIPLMEIEEITNNNFLNDLFQKYQKTISLIIPN